MMTAVATATGWSLRRDARVPAEAPAQPRQPQEMEATATHPSPAPFPPPSSHSLVEGTTGFWLI